MVLDAHGRQVSHLRISITQRCNQSCLYCHNEGHYGSWAEMSPSEIARLVHIAKDLGINRLKLTGGEPLLRRDILRVIKEASKEIADVSLTTNGILLAPLAKRLKLAGLGRVNISLDSLDDGTYRRITGGGNLGMVIKGLDAAVAAGLNPVKINMVILRAMNDKELERMLRFAREHGAVLQLIELEVPRELTSAPFFTQYHEDLSRHELELEKKAIDKECRPMNHRTIYFLPQEVEVVRPMHNSQFCANCHRIRITSDGLLKPCLLSESGVIDVLSPLRSGASESDLRSLFLRAIRARKPYWN